MAEFPSVPKDYLTTSFLAELKAYIDEKASEGGGGGGGSSALVVNATVTEHTATLDKTWQEIWDALDSGRPAYLKFPYNEWFGWVDSIVTGIQLQYMEDEGDVMTYSVIITEEVIFTTADPDEYPTFE